MNFIAKKIKGEEETIAEKLSGARAQIGLDIDEIAQTLRIKKEYLNYLENGEYDKLPGGIYAKTFLKKYAKFLKVDYKKIEENFNKEKEWSKLNTDKKNQKDVFSRKRIKSYEFLVFPKIIKNILIVILVSAFFLYIGFYLKTSFSPPKIEIIEPSDNLITESNFVYVIGKTSSKTEIIINNKPILKDTFGIFKEKVDLKHGVNTIIITAKNKYSKKTIITKQVLVK